MPSDFDWQTEPDEWHSPARDDRSQMERPGISRTPIVLLFLVIAAALLIYRGLDQQTQLAQQDIVEEITATHRLVQSAVANSDEELFNSLLVDVDGQWGQLQRQMFQRGLLLDRAPLGLFAAPAASEPISVTISPDLERANVSFPASFMVTDPEGNGEAITLNQSAAYRRTDNDWRMADFPEDFWGNWIRNEAGQITFVYPAREGALGARLAQDLRGIWESYCRQMGNCSPAAEVQVRFETNLNGLPEPSVAIHGRDQRTTLGLPSPTLVGLPVDEPGYQALLRGYSRQIVGHFVGRQLVPDDLAYREAYRQAWIANFLVNAGLAPWPPAPPPEAPSSLVVLPTEDLVTACIDASGRGSSLYRYNMAAESWRIIWSGDAVISFEPLPNKDGLLIQARGDAGNMQLLLWRPGQEPLVWPGEYYVLPDRVGRGALLVELSSQPNWRGFRINDFAACVTADCETLSFDGDYVVWSADGNHSLSRTSDSDTFRLQSHDGSEGRLVGSGNLAFWINNRQYGLVASTAWTEWQEQEILVGDISDGQSRALLTTADLVAALPELARLAAEDQGLLILDVFPDPLLTGRFYALAVTGLDFTSSFYGATTETHVFEVDPSDKLAIKRILDVVGPSHFRESLRFSPDGRWLLLETVQPELDRTTLHLLDRQTGSRVNYDFSEVDYVYPLGEDWTADGNWLVRNQSGVLHLMHPQTALEYEIVPPVAGCVSAAWLPR